MKLLIRKADNVVLQTGAMTLKPTGFTSDTRRSKALTPDIVSVVTYAGKLPNGYIDGCWQFINGEWSVLPDKQTAADSVIDQERKKRQEEKRKAFRKAWEQAVSEITVTTSAGNTYNGDETSQNRLARAILRLQATGAATIQWTLADNSTILATEAELTEALTLAGEEQERLWMAKG